MKFFAQSFQLSADTAKKQSLATILFFIAVASVWTLHLLKPLFDPDFYWHLKTGCWIWDNKALPASDPFTIPPHPEASFRIHFVLTSYWLFQLLLCAFYKLGGFGGIFVLRFILVGAFIAVFYRFSITRTLTGALLAGAGITQILAQHFPERPQFISFVCAAMLLATIFSWLRSNRGFLPLLLPLGLTMLLWANMHGGFMLGQVLLLAVLLAEALKFLHPRLSPLPRRDFTKLAVSTVGAILISFANPNHVNFSLEMLSTVKGAHDLLGAQILEYSNLYEYYTIVGGPEPIIAICTYLFVFLLFIRSRERTNITWAGLLILLGVMGVRHVRYYPMFLVCATLFVIQHAETKAWGRISRLVVILFFIIVAATSLTLTPRNLRLLASYGGVPASYFPVKACDFIKENGITGNVFTLMNWGGYVLWRLGPHQKVFIDGRQIDPERFREYFALDNWKPLYDKYDIRVLILPIYDEQRKPSAHTEAVRMDPGWKLVAIGNNGVVFVRSN